MATQTLSRKERDRRLREEDFLNAAEKLIGQKGYHETSMEDVAREAEYATGTIYRYFASKEDLYHQLLARKGRAFFDDMHRVLSDDQTAAEQLRALLLAEVRFYEENSAFMRVYFQEFHDDDERMVCRMPKDVQKSFAGYMQTWRDLLSRGMQEGVFNTLDVELTLAGLTGFFKQVMQRWLLGDFKGSREDVEAFIFDFLTGGLIKRKTKGR